MHEDRSDPSLRRIDAVRIGEAKDSKAAASGDATWLLYAQSNQQLSFDVDNRCAKLVDKNFLRKTLTFFELGTERNSFRSRYLNESPFIPSNPKQLDNSLYRKKLVEFQRPP